VKKRTPTPIPPLGDAAIARIERGLFAALDSELREAARPLEAARPAGGRRRRFALAGVAAAAAVFVGGFATREARRGEALPARAAQISTTTSGSRIALAGATLEVAPQSAVSFGGGRDGAMVVVLDRGTVTCEVAPRSKRAPFVVEAGATHVTVIGTKFSVRRVGGHATVSVEHGLVEVADTNMTELVHAGERYQPGEPVALDVLASEPVAKGANAPATTAASDGGHAVVSAPSASSSTQAAFTARAEAPVATAMTRVRAHVRRLARADGANDASPKEAPAADPAAPLAPAVAAPDSTSTPGDAPPAKAPADGALAGQRRSVQVLFELAAQLELRDPEAALRIYGELAAAESPADGGWAASALFAAARLEAERGQAQRARELSETYLRRFPSGPNADDARTLLAAPSR
jgi:hypothetical protein